MSFIMVKPSASSDNTREPIKTRQKSASQDRRNSVGEITEYFKQMADTPGKTKGTSSKHKDKESKRQPVKNNKENKDNEPSTKENAKLNANGKENEKEQCNNHGIDHTDMPEELNIPNGENHLTPSKENNAQVALTQEHSDAETQTTSDALLKTVQAMQSQLNKMEEVINDPRNGLSSQLAKTQEKLQNIHSDIHGAVDGILVKMQNLTTSSEANTAKILQLETGHKRMAAVLDENKRLVQELRVMQGLVQKISQQSLHTNNKVLDLTKRGMEQNLVIHGVDDTTEIEDSKRATPMFKPKERCKYSAIGFFKDIMNLDIHAEDVWKAHRMGAKKPNKVRPLIVKLSYPAKDLVLENISTLKGRKNEKTQQTYFIADQIPEGITEMKKQTSSRAKTLNEENKKLPDEEKKRIQIFNDQILVDGELDQPHITTPQPSDLFLPIDDQKRIDNLQSKLVETDSIYIKNSQFSAMALKVHSLAEVRDAYIAVAQRYSAADHIMAAYALKDKGSLFSGSCDDREFGASIKIKNLIFETKARNTAVFVIRKFGGIHLGYERFQAIQQVTTKALELLAASL